VFITTRYPNLIWDNLPHAGASQVHPHVHTMMDPSQYYGAHHIQQEAARRYHQYTGNKFWDDLIEIHHALGLTVSLGSAVAVAPLVQFFLSSFAFCHL
jgi:galactose-1-phosphate uridylyltransferase